MNMVTRQASLGDMFKTIDKILSLAWGRSWGKFVKAYPSTIDKRELTLPTITYRVKSKTPSKMGSHLEIKPRIREKITTDKDQITVWGQRFDCIVEFGIWGEGDYQVSDLAEKFEDFMLTYTSVLKEMGIVEIVYSDTSDERPPNSWRVDLDSRHIYYFVIIEKVTPVSQSTLQGIKLKLLNEEDDLLEQVNSLH
jgi:hypothetical protein